jgi:hypothetical protein
MADGQEEIIWEAHEFPYQPKTPVWYWTSIVLTILLMLWALWEGNILFAIFIMIAEIMVFIWAKELPQLYQFRLHEAGLTIGEDKHYHYSDLHHYSIFTPEDGNTELIFVPRRRIALPVRVPIHSELSDDIRSLLGNRLPEHEYEETLPESLYRIIKF